MSAPSGPSPVAASGPVAGSALAQSSAPGPVAAVPAASLGELRAFREESVTRMDGVDLGFGRDAHDIGDIEIQAVDRRLKRHAREPF